MEEVSATVIGVGKISFVGCFALFRTVDSEEQFRPGWVIQYENTNLGAQKSNKIRMSVLALDTRERIHDAPLELKQVSPDDFAGRGWLKGFLVKHSGFGICKTIDEERHNGKHHFTLSSRKHGIIPGPVPISELEFIGF